MLLQLILLCIGDFCGRWSHLDPEKRVARRSSTSPYTLDGRFHRSASRREATIRPTCISSPQPARRNACPCPPPRAVCPSRRCGPTTPTGCRCSSPESCSTASSTTTTRRTSRSTALSTCRRSKRCKRRPHPEPRRIAFVAAEHLRLEPLTSVNTVLDMTRNESLKRSTLNPRQNSKGPFNCHLWY